MLEPIGLALTAALLAGAPTLTWDDFDATRDAVLPTAEEERWLDIPWRSAFSDAVAEAREQGKPILLWAMNGHPLGCV